MVKRKPVNLNSLVNSDRKRQKVVNNMKIHFDGASIVKAIVRRINNDDTRYIIGCSAWFTNAKIISAMSLLDGVCIICTRDKITRAKTTQDKYKTLPTLNGAKSPIHIIGSGRGYNKSLMHHKFLVGLDKNQLPIWVSNGSFNMTTSAVNHIENCMIIDDDEVAEVFKQEFLRLFPVSKALKIK
jgi:phosphatidylserine/phosphatidylglycerophosphate/cardiolipin synthase-like enzyme